MTTMKKKTKSKVQSCPCACAPPPPKRRRAPTYTPRAPPQFYAALPMPQTQFDTDTIRRVVQDEFKRYHAPRKTLMVSGTQTETDFDFPDDETEETFGMTSALEEMRKVGGIGIVREAEQADIDLDDELAILGMEQRPPSLGGFMQASDELEREEEMERARRAFKPTPSMAQRPPSLGGFMQESMARAEARGLPFTLPPGVETELGGFE